LEAAGLLRRPVIPHDCETNYHMYYILLPDRATRDGLMTHLNHQGINAVFHYVPLHSSPMGQTFGYREGDLPVTEDVSGRLLRLPLYYEITEAEQEQVVNEITARLRSQRSRPLKVRPAVALA
jgi:dTDP-4-amino-4,6-dideoxygalactose transaminase